MKALLVVLLIGVGFWMGGAWTLAQVPTDPPPKRVEVVWKSSCSFKPPKKQVRM